MSDLHGDVFAISPDIRYVAVAHGQQVQKRSRPGLHNASSSDSDLYEELLVNPTLLTLATQRGNIDCGGLRYLIIGLRPFPAAGRPQSGRTHLHRLRARRQPSRSPASDLACDGTSRPARVLEGLAEVPAVAFGVVDGVCACLAGSDADLGNVRAGGLRAIPVGWHVGNRNALHLGHLAKFAGSPESGPGEPSMMTPPPSSSSSPCLTVPSLRLSRTRSVKAKVLISQSIAAPASAYKR